MTGFSIEHVDFANVHRDFALKIQGDFPAVMDLTHQGTNLNIEVVQG